MGNMKDNQFVITNQSWRTAFTIPIKSSTSSSSTTSATTSISIISLLSVSYLILSAFDWFSIIQSFACNILEQQSLEYNNVIHFTVDGIAYVLRHVIVYLTLVKLFISWDVKNDHNDDAF